MRKRSVFLAIILVLILLTGCVNSDSENLQEEKLVRQIEYLDNRIIGMLHILNYDYPADINWDELKREIELLNSSWGAIVINLHAMQVDGEDILAFSRDLDIAIINITGEYKIGSLVSLARLYSYLPKYLAVIPERAPIRHIKQTKSYIIDAYALIEQRNWDDIARLYI